MYQTESLVAADFSRDAILSTVLAHQRASLLPNLTKMQHWERTDFSHGGLCESFTYKVIPWS
jgi:hypothetical protein